MFLHVEEIRDARKSVHNNKLETLKKNYEFQFVFRKGNRFGAKYFTLIVAPCRKKFSKFGFVISKKIGKAFLRNKRRRQFKEIVRSLLDNIKVNQYVFVARENIEFVDFEELKKDIFTVFQKNKFFKEK